jgi:hypothetical protein
MRGVNRNKCLRTCIKQVPLFLDSTRGVYESVKRTCELLAQVTIISTSSSNSNSLSIKM